MIGTEIHTEDRYRDTQKISTEIIGTETDVKQERERVQRAIDVYVSVEERERERGLKNDSKE